MIVRYAWILLIGKLPYNSLQWTLRSSRSSLWEEVLDFCLCYISLRQFLCYQLTLVERGELLLLSALFMCQKPNVSPLRLHLLMGMRVLRCFEDGEQGEDTY